MGVLDYVFGGVKVVGGIFATIYGGPAGVPIIASGATDIMGGVKKDVDANGAKGAEAKAIQDKTNQEVFVANFGDPNQPPADPAAQDQQAYLNERGYS